jgi:hypothetical protein
MREKATRRQTRRQQGLDGGACEAVSSDSVVFCLLCLLCLLCCGSSALFTSTIRRVPRGCALSGSSCMEGSSLLYYCTGQFVGTIQHTIIASSHSPRHSHDQQCHLVCKILLRRMSSFARSFSVTFASSAEHTFSLRTWPTPRPTPPNHCSSPPPDPTILHTPQSRGYHKSFRKVSHATINVPFGDKDLLPP